MSGWTAVTAAAADVEEFERQLRETADGFEFERRELDDGNPCWFTSFDVTGELGDAILSLDAVADWVSVVTNNDTEPNGKFTLYLPSHGSEHEVLVDDETDEYDVFESDQDVDGYEVVDEYEERVSELVMGSERDDEPNSPVIGEFKTTVGEYADAVYGIRIASMPLDEAAYVSG